MRPDLARLTEEERAILTRWEMATKEPRAHIATVLKGYALDDIPVALASIADLRAELDRVEGELLEAVKSGNWARAEAIDAKGRAVVAEQRVRDAKSVCNRANKMMTGEMIVYVSDIRAALEPKP